jgi:2-hydroxy-3-oxopropionate reductase
MEIGFIGLGIMGRPMAANLLAKGHRLYVYDLNQEAVKSLVDKGAETGSLSEIGAACSLIFTILPNGGIVQDVLFAEGGLAATLAEGSIVVDMSSVASNETLFCSKKLKEQGVAFLDAPVSGGEPKAVDGTLAFMIGGEEDVFKKLEPVLMDMGASALLVGGSGAGSTTKLANQIIVNLNIAAVSEALVFASKAGVDPAKVYQAIRGGLAGSAVLDAKAPLMCQRNFKPGGKISVNHKDIKNVLVTAHAIDAPVPFSAQLFEIMQTLKVKGHFDDDHGGIVQYFEELASCKVQEGSES